jgi:hypothetical protein
MKKIATAGALAMLACGPAMAQSADWSYAATIYGWVPALGTKVDTAYGTIDAGLSSSDALSNLDFAFMGVFEARNGPWSVIVDGLYTDLSLSQPTPFGVLFSDAAIKTKLSAVSGYLAYRVYDTSGMAIDIAGGLRAFGVDMAVTLNPGTLPAESSTASKTWVVPVIGARMIVPFNDKWSATVFVDFGGTGSDDQTWQALASINYRINDNWSTRVGYREMDLENVIGGRATKINLSGPFIAASYNF